MKGPNPTKIEKMRHALQVAEEAATLEPKERDDLVDAESRADSDVGELLEWLDLQPDSSARDRSDSDAEHDSAPLHGNLSFDPTPKREKGDRIGPYQVLEKLGEGGMGEVYAAERVDGEVQRQVAIKVIARRKANPRLHRRFLAERQILAGLDHANIARMLDAGTTDDGLSFLVMERVDGLPIDQFCVENSYTLAQRLELFKKVASAVAHAHQRLVVHRDLKPSNILVDPQGEPKLLDFGIAKLVDPSAGANATRTAHAMTPKWASPEQLRGELITTSTDVYSLGLLLYKLVAGRLPHDPDVSLLDLARRTFETDAPTRPSRYLADLEEPAATENWPREDLKRIQRQTQGDLDNIILKALRYDAESRYPSVEAFLEDLRRLRSGEPVSATRDTIFYLAKKFIGRNRWPVAMLIMVGLFLTAFFAQRERQAGVIREESRRTEITNAFLSDLFGDADAKARAGEKVDLKMLLDAGTERLESGDITDPNIRAKLLEILGEGYLNLNLWTEALAVLSEAETLLRQIGLDEELAHVLVLRSGALVVTGDLEQAEKAVSEASALSKLTLDEVIDREARISEAFVMRHAFAEIQQNNAEGYALLEEISETSDFSERYDELMDKLYFWSSSLLNAGYMQDFHQAALDVYQMDGVKGFKKVLLTSRNLSGSLMYTHRSRMCAKASERIVEAHDRGRSHRHSVDRSFQLFILGRCLGAAGDTARGLEVIDEGLQSTIDLLKMSPGDFRAKYQEGLGYQYRAMVHESSGDSANRDVDLQRSRSVLEALLQEKDSPFLHNAYAITLMMQGEVELAKPVVKDLLWRGWRRPDFMDLAAENGVLPKLMPPPLRLKTEVPPTLRSYIDSLPEVPFPWDEDFDIELWRSEPENEISSELPMETE